MLILPRIFIIYLGKVYPQRGHCNHIVILICIFLMLGEFRHPSLHYYSYVSALFQNLFMIFDFFELGYFCVCVIEMVVSLMYLDRRYCSNV
jgi:hypothetical protein